MVIAIAALRQAKTAAKQATMAAEQASTAARRHNAQTDADRQRRITESYAKATEQLGSEKMEARLAAIYTLERISKESPDDYWTVMETLTAFVRERAPVKRADEIPAGDRVLRGPATDIEAILKILRRRHADSQQREAERNWNFDLRGTNLRLANLTSADLSQADLFGTDLSHAGLTCANLTGTLLSGADLSHTNLRSAYLTDALLSDAILFGADLTDAILMIARDSGLRSPSIPI